MALLYMQFPLPSFQHLLTWMIPHHLSNLNFNVTLRKNRLCTSMFIPHSSQYGADHVILDLLVFHPKDRTKSFGH